MKRVSNTRSNFIGGASPRHPMVGSPVVRVPSTIGANIGHAPSTISMASTDTMNTSATQESVILELSRRLGEREAEIRSISAQKRTLEGHVANLSSPRAQAGNMTLGAEAYETLLAHYREREEELRMATQLNNRLNAKLKEMERVHRETEGQRSQLARLAAVEGEKACLQTAMEEAKKVIEKKERTIAKLTAEKENLTQEAEEGEKKEKELREDIARFQELFRKGKTLAEGQVIVLKENEETIGRLEDRCRGLEEMVEGLRQQLEENEHSIESKDTLLNMQRQEMDKQLSQIQVFETQFQAKDMDVPKLIARAAEGERLWSKIAERQKKFESKEVMIGALRSENASLVKEKKELQAKVDELKKCSDFLNLKLGATGDKVHMPWLLGQLRDTVQLKEKILELEEIIKGEGYTVRAAAAEADFKKQEDELKATIDRLAETLATLKAQVPEEKDVEVPVLIGKLEECLLDYGYDVEKMRPLDDIVTQILSAASSDINHSMSLNTVDSEEKWVRSRCITVRDLKDFMDPDHYTVASNLENGCHSLKTDGLCTGPNVEADEDDDDEEEAVKVEDDDNDIVDEDKENAREGEDKEEVAEEEDKEEVPKPDIHMQKVLKVLTRNESDVSDWRDWISPLSAATKPASPFSSVTNKG